MSAERIAELLNGLNKVIRAERSNEKDVRAGQRWRVYFDHRLVTVRIVDVFWNSDQRLRITAIIEHSGKRVMLKGKSKLINELPS